MALQQGEVWDCIIGSLCLLLSIPNFIQAYTDLRKPKRSKTGHLNKLIHNALWITSILLAMGSFIMANYDEHPRLAAVSYSFNEIAAGIYTFALTQICINALRSLFIHCGNLHGNLPRWQIFGLWSLNVLCVALWIMAIFAMTVGNKPTSWKSGSYFANACVLLALSGLLIYSKWTLRGAEAQIKAAAAAQKKTNAPPVPWYKRKPDPILLLTSFTLVLCGWVGFQCWRVWTHKESYSDYDTKKYAIVTAVMARALGLCIVSITTYVLWDSSQVDVVFPRLSKFTRDTVTYLENRMSVHHHSTTTSSRAETHGTPSQPSRETRPFLREFDSDGKSPPDTIATPTHAGETRSSVELQTPESKTFVIMDPSPDKGENTEKQPLTTTEIDRPTIILTEGEEETDHSRNSITLHEKMLFTTSVSAIVSSTQEGSHTPTNSQRVPTSHSNLQPSDETSTTS